MSGKCRQEELTSSTTALKIRTPRLLTTPDTANRVSPLHQQEGETLGKRLGGATRAGEGPSTS